MGGCVTRSEDKILTVGGGPDPALGIDPPTSVAGQEWREAVPNDRLAHLVKDALRGLSRGLQMRLTGHDVSFGHWTFLRILWEHDGLTQRELSEHAGLMESTTFSALVAMEKLGYVVRRHLPENRKKVHVFLTPEGRALKDTLVPLAEEVNAIAVRGVDPDDIAATRRTLVAMVQNLIADEVDGAKEQRRMPSTRQVSRIIDRSERRRNGAKAAGATRAPKAP